MYCPECESEYRDGFDQCPDCQCGLVYELSAREKDKKAEERTKAEQVTYVRIGEYELNGAALLDSFLSTSDIAYYFEEKIGLKGNPSKSVLWVGKESRDDVLLLLQDLARDDQGE